MLHMLLVKLNLEDKLGHPKHHRVATVVCWLETQALISKYR